MTIGARRLHHGIGERVHTLITDRVATDRTKNSISGKVHAKQTTPAGDAATTISKEYTLLLSRDEFVEALYPVSDLASLEAFKAPLVKWRRALMFPASIAALSALAGYVVHLDSHIATLIGFIAGCVCTGHIRSQHDVAIATRLIARRFRKSSLGFGDLVEIDQAGIHFSHTGHNRHIRSYPWISIRSFAISQDAIVIRTSTASQVPVVLPLRLFTEPEQLQFVRWLIALTR